MAATRGKDREIPPATQFPDDKHQKPLPPPDISGMSMYLDVFVCAG